MMSEAIQGTLTDAPAQSAEAPAKVAPSVDEGSLLGGGTEASVETKDVATDNPAEAKAESGESKATDSVIPETYNITVPEGMELDKAALDVLTPVFKEMELTQAKVDKLTEAYAPVMKAKIEAAVKAGAETATKAHEEAAVSQFKETVAGWKKETQAHFGANLSKDLAHAARFIDKYSDDAKGARELLANTGLGNHPAIVKLFVAAGKALASDAIVGQGSAVSTSGGSDEESYLRRNYPSNFKE